MDSLWVGVQKMWKFIMTFVKNPLESCTDCHNGFAHTGCLFLLALLWMDGWIY